MACGATLKRSHEFDSLHSPGRSPKRVCGELISSPKPQCPNYSHPPAFVEAAHKLANGEMISGLYWFECKLITVFERMWYFTTTYFCWSDFNFKNVGQDRCHELPHRVHRAHYAASRRARRVTGCFTPSSVLPFSYLMFPAYFPAYSVKTQAPSSRCINYISVRCAWCMQCSISWHLGRTGLHDWLNKQKLLVIYHYYKRNTVKINPHPTRHFSVTI